MSSTQSCHQERSLDAGLQLPDSTAASLIAGGGHQNSAVGLSAGTAAQTSPVDATGTVEIEAAHFEAAEVHFERAQQGFPRRLQGKDSNKPDSAAPNAPNMPGLAATLQLLHQIDLETVGHHAGSSQLPTVLQSDNASQQPSLEHHAAADAAAGDDSHLLDSSAVAEAAGVPEHWHDSSSAALTQADAVHQSEKALAQELSGSSQEAESPQQQAGSAEKESQQHPKVQVLVAEETGSTPSQRAQDSLTDGSHAAASWGMQEQASNDLEGNFSAGPSYCISVVETGDDCPSVTYFVADTESILQCKAQHQLCQHDALYVVLNAAIASWCFQPVSVRCITHPVTLRSD